MSYEDEQYTTVRVNPRITIKILFGVIAMIFTLVSYCFCGRRRQRNTEIVVSRPVVNSSYSNALIPAIKLPPSRTNNYQAPRTQLLQPASNAPSASDASDLPPSYDQFNAKQPPKNHAAH